MAVKTTLDWGLLQHEDAVCACQSAVQRSYFSARQRGCDANAAILSAMRVYQHHHPKASSDAAYAVVSDWVSPGSLN